MAGTMLLGYDVEWSGEGRVTAQFLEQARALHNRLGVPATLFIVGQTLERWVPEFQAVSADPLFDLQQHTYSHQLLKTVCIDDGTTVRVIPGVSLEETRLEVRRASAVLRERLGATCRGLTGPWCYYRGLRDRPDILRVLWEEGIRFTRTDGRNERDYFPAALDRQPYWYDPQGFPEILEIPIHGWVDNQLRARSGWENLDGYVAAVREYIDQAMARDWVFSLCQHDWSSIREDPEMRATAAILEYAQERGLRCLSYAAYYAEAARERAVTMSAG